MVGFRVSTAFAAVLLVGAGAEAQEAQSRFSLGAGVAAYDGARGDAGFGLTGSVQAVITELGRVEVTGEAGLQGLAALGQTCSLGVPSSCSPEDPAFPMWHARLAIGSRRGGSLPVFATFGFGVSSPAGPAGAPTVAWSADGGAGVRVHRKVSLEVRYVHLRAQRHVGTTIPILIRLDL